MNQREHNQLLQNQIARENKKKESVSEFFIYTASFGSIAAAGDGQVNIQIESDSLFVVQKLTYFCTDAAEAQQTANTRILPNLTIQIVDSGSGRNLQNSPVPLTSLCGVGELPHILATPKTFKANAIITVNLANFGVDALANIFVDFIGKKIFKIGPIGG